MISVDQDRNLRKWQVNKLTTDTSIPVVTSLPKAINWMQYTYSSDGVLLAAMVSGTTITILDVEHNRKIATLTHKEIIQKVHFSQRGSQLAMIGTDTIQIWNIAKSEPQSSTIREHVSVCGAVKFSPDRKTLATGYWSGEIHLQDIQG